MKTLEEIKDEVAREYGRVGWDTLDFGYHEDTVMPLIDEVAKRYAEQFAKLAMPVVDSDTKTLSQIKECVAKESGWKDWQEAKDETIGIADWSINEIAKRYATEAIKADRERVADNAKTTRSCSVWNCEGESVDKESILNLPYELP